MIPQYPTTCPECGADLTENGKGVNVAVEDYVHGWVDEDGDLQTGEFDQCGDTSRAFCDCGYYLFDSADTPNEDAQRNLLFDHMVEMRRRGEATEYWGQEDVARLIVLVEEYATYHARNLVAEARTDSKEDAA